MQDWFGFTIKHCWSVYHLVYSMFACQQTITLVNSKMLRYQKTIISLCFWCAEPKYAVRFLRSRLKIEIFAFYFTYFLVNSGLL